MVYDRSIEQIINLATGYSTITVLLLSLYQSYGGLYLLLTFKIIKLDEFNRENVAIIIHSIKSIKLIFTARDDKRNILCCKLKLFSL